MVLTYTEKFSTIVELSMWFAMFSGSAQIRNKFLRNHFAVARVFCVRERGDVEFISDLSGLFIYVYQAEY